MTVEGAQRLAKAAQLYRQVQGRGVVESKQRQDQTGHMQMDVGHALSGGDVLQASRRRLRGTSAQMAIVRKLKHV
jgi:hypothetical protein